ncbi:MAG: helix-turn-helix domain-containing protein [Clostridia bacterium]
MPATDNEYSSSFYDNCFFAAIKTIKVIFNIPTLILQLSGDCAYSYCFVKFKRKRRITTVYRLNEFCNIIAFLRKEKSMTQTALAEKLGISPQSVSKWECGIGYPDVTLFPVIAE